MSNYTDNNIIFNNVKDISVPISGAIGVRGAQGVDPEFGGIINAIDIDWNGMQLGEEHVINTTGELASYISTASTEINNIRTDLSSNYITTSEADNKYLKFSGSSSTIISDENISNWDTAYADINTHLSTSGIHVTTEDRVKWNGKVDRSELDNYQPKGNYLPLTGGTITESGEIQDKPSPDTMPIYTKITPGTIQFGDIRNEETVSNFINIDTISENGSKSEINLSYNIANPRVTYDCIITPDDVVLKVDNAEVKKLSEACQGGATVTGADTSKWNTATTNINSHLSDTAKHVSDDERSAWNDKADSSELANYLPLTGGTIQKKTEGGQVSKYDKTINISPNKIDLNNSPMDDAIKNVNITVDGISVKSSVSHITSSSTSETTYCTIKPNDVIIKNNDVEINGLSYLLKKINDLKNRIDALESKTGGTIKDPTQQGTINKPETEVVTP